MCFVQSLKFKKELGNWTVESLHLGLSYLTHHFQMSTLIFFHLNLLKWCRRIITLSIKSEWKKNAVQDLIFRSHEFLLIWEYTVRSSEKVISNLYQGCLFQMPLCSEAVTLQKKIGNLADRKIHGNLPTYSIFLKSVLKCENKRW